jgi:multiple sugar transport system ATP-binding protein
MAPVSIRGLRKSYGTVEAVAGIDLEIADREFVVLVGASGCGKSTTLRMIAGLEEASGGEIWIGGKQVDELEPKDRDIAMVFQDYALYPHLSVAENIGFGLRYRGHRKAEIARKTQEAAAILGIGELLDRYPRQLSGGQRQRVAMGRAIVRDPKVFLFDEPLSNLDAKLRVQMRTEIKRLHQRVSTTVVYVTHDQVEAMTLADRIVLMRKGAIEQVGTPDELYNHPATVYVAGFIGAPTMNLLDAELLADGASAAVRLADGTSWTLPSRPGAPGRIKLGLRPETLAPEMAGGAPLRGVVEVVEPLGSDTLVFMAGPGGEVVARLPPQFAPRPGETLTLSVDPARLHLFDAATGRALGA